MLELQFRLNVYKMLVVEMGRAGPCVVAVNLEHLMRLLRGVEYKPFEAPIGKHCGYAIKVCVLVGGEDTSLVLVLLDLFKG